MNIIKAKEFRGRLQIAHTLLAATVTGVNLCIENHSSLTGETRKKFEESWSQQLTLALAEIETAQRLLAQPKGV